MLGDELSLYLKLDDGNGFVHLGCQALGLLVYGSCATTHLGHKFCTFIILVGFHGKSGQGDKVDAVAFFQGGEVGIAQAQTDHIANAGVITCGSTHPEYIVVAPLYIPTVVMAHLVEDDVGSRSTIVDVAEDVQLVYGKPLYHIGYGDDEVVGTSCGYDGVDDDVDISCLVVVFGMFVQEFLYDVREVAG